jgi:hypothetical protein
MKILLAPLTKIANLIEDQKEMVKEVHAFLTVDLKKVTVDNSKELKKQTILLTDIRDLLKEQIKQKQSEQSGKAPKIKLPGIIGGIGVGLAIVTMAAALVAAAGIFTLMPSVSASQILTALAIGAVFVILTPMFVDIQESLRGGGVISRLIGRAGGVGVGSTKEMLKGTGGVALAMISMALGVMASSFILSAIKPITFTQFATATLIGFAFIPLSFAFAQIIKGLQRARVGMDAKGFKRLGMVTLSMTAMALGIAMVARIWNFTMPDEFVKLPSLGWTLKAGLLIWIFSAGFSKILKTIKGVSVKDMVFATLALPLLAISLVGVAWIFQYFSEVSQWVAPPIEWTLKAGLAMLVFGLPFVAISMIAKRAGIKGLLLGALAIGLIGVSILASAWIFSYLAGVEFIAPPTEWAIAAALAITIFAIPLTIIGLIATSGVGAVGLLLGAAGIILIAGTMWVVAWIFSKLPDLSAISKNFTDALMYPVNAMIDSLARFKNEIGIENMIPLAGGLLAIAGGWLALTAALAGTAVGGLIQGVANVGTAILDGISGLFGGGKTKSPIDLLDMLIARSEGIKALANPVKELGKGFAQMTRFTESVIRSVTAFSPFLDGIKAQNFTTSANAATILAAAYSSMAASSKLMNVPALQASARMFEAIAKIAENKGQDAISELAESLMAAVKELSETVKNLEDASSGQQEGIKDAISGAMSSFIDRIKGKTDETGKETGLVDIEPIVLAIQELEERFDRAIKVQAI